MSELTYIYSLLISGMLGGLLGAGLCVSSALGDGETFRDPMKMNFITVSAALSFSSAVYCLIILLMIFVEVVVDIPSDFIWAAAAMAGASLISGLGRGLLTRSRVSSNEWNFQKQIMSLVGFEVIVIPALVYSLLLLFV